MQSTSQTGSTSRLHATVQPKQGQCGTSVQVLDAAGAVATKVRLAAGTGEAFADWQSALVRAAS
ncbi:hypothetical protein, partial [Stenotrophomonas maltophilia]